MPFIPIEIQKERQWKSIFLFLILFGMYYLGFLVLGKIIIVWLGLGLESTYSIPGWRFFYHTFLIALGAAVCHLYFAIHGAVDRILSTLKAKDPDPMDRYHQQYINIIQEIQIATGGRKVRPVVISTPAANAFAIATNDHNAVIGITEGMLSRLNRPQLENVIAHEMAHVLNNDCVLVTIACSMFAVYAQLLRLSIPSDNKSRGGDGGAGSAVIILVLAFFTFASYLLNMAISRQREYLADATAIRMTRNPIAMAEALLRVSQCWRGFADDSLAPIFILSPSDKGLEESNSFFSTLMTTHPPLQDRLKVLLGMAHSDLPTVIKSVIAQDQSVYDQRTVLPDTQTAPVADSSSNPLLWYIRQDLKWTGPFNIDQIKNQPDFTPETWICRSEDRKVMKAREESNLYPLFQNTLAQSTSASNLCPRCLQSMSSFQYEGTYISRCHSCEGYLVTDEQIYRIITRKEVAFTPEFIQKAQQTNDVIYRNSVKKFRANQQDATPNLKCPHCKTPMMRAFYSYQYFVIVDRSYSCNRIWFDKGELEILQALIEAKT